MNALYVLNDQTLFETESSTRVVMREHARQIGILHILSPGNAKKIEHEDLGDGKALVIHSMGYSRSLLFYNLKRRIRKLIKKENIEIVSAQDPFEYGWMAMKAVKGTSAKLHINVQTDVLSPWFIRGNITRISHMRMPLSNRLRRMVVDRILLQADGIRVPSLRVANSLSARYGKKIVLPTIMPPQTSGHLKESITISARAFTFTLLTVGPLEPDKRIQDILHALAYAHRLYPSVGLVIVGEGSEMKNIQEKVVRLGLTQNVLFMGNQIDPIGLMQSADVYIQANAYEAYSSMLVHAALARTPIISTDVGLVGEVFKGYVDLLSAPPGDPMQLSTHITGLIEDIAMRRNYVINAEKAAQDHLAAVHASPKNVADDLRECLKSQKPKAV